MIYEIPEEIINNTKLCYHKHGCLVSSAIFPQCIPTGKKGDDWIEVKKKSYCLGGCLYATDIKGNDKDKDAYALCFCPVRCNIFKMYGK